MSFIVLLLVVLIFGTAAAIPSFGVAVGLIGGLANSLVTMRTNARTRVAHPRNARTRAPRTIHTSMRLRTYELVHAPAPATALAYTRLTAATHRAASRAL